MIGMIRFASRVEVEMLWNKLRFENGLVPGREMELTLPIKPSSFKLVSRSFVSITLTSSKLLWTTDAKAAQKVLRMGWLGIDTHAQLRLLAVPYVAGQGNVELNEIEEVRSISYGRSVVIRPAWDLGRAELYTM